MTDPILLTGSSRGHLARANAASRLTHFREIAHD
jgi:hypothetical protein